MTVRISRGDRRLQPRFQVIGQFWMSLDFEADVLLRDVATGGMLIESVFETPFKPIRAARIALPGDSNTIDAIVRHVTRLEPVSERRETYLIGFEFVNMTPATRMLLERVVDDWQNRTGA